MTKFRLVLSRLAHVRDFVGFRTTDSCALRPFSVSSTTVIHRDPSEKHLSIGVRYLSSAEIPSHVILGMPALSPTMNQGNISKWRKKEGDKIDVGDVICEIETDKATLEFESLEEGFLAKILAPEGSKDVLVGQPIAITVEDPDEIKNLPSTISSGEAMKEQKSTSGNVEPKMNSESKSFSRISPSAKLLIAEFGLDASTLKASGPRDTLSKGDVLAAIKSRGGSLRTSASSQGKPPATMVHSPLPAPSTPQLGAPSHRNDTHEDLPNSQIRKVIARRLIESKQNTPHLYLSSDVILDRMLAFRCDLKEQHNVKVSVNDILIKAVALALRNVPEVNAYWNEEKGEASLCGSVDISVAVATDKGLMTPIVRNADQKTLSSISAEVKELAEKARAGRLTPVQYQGGTFSISNLGMFPVDHFSAIINPPQACILAVGRGMEVVQPLVGSDGTEKPAVVTKMNLKLSADHRVFDGELGGKFLAALVANLNETQRLLL